MNFPVVPTPITLSLGTNFVRFVTVKEHISHLEVNRLIIKVNPKCTYTYSLAGRAKV